MSLWTSGTVSIAEIRPMTSLSLLVEDNEATVDVMREQLTFLGYRVTTAKNGAEAVAKAVAELPNLIVMDIQRFQQLKERWTNDKWCV